MSTFRTLMITVAALALITPAHATFYNNPPPPPFAGGAFECSIVNQNPQPRRDSDPVYKIDVSVLLNGPSLGSFDVMHTVRSGRVYDRSTQYDNSRLWQTAGKMEWNWTGQRGGNTMIGSLYHNDRDGWMYREGLIANGRVAYTMLSDCHEVGQD
jgi:hypothetical protein